MALLMFILIIKWLKLFNLNAGLFLRKLPAHLNSLYSGSSIDWKRLYLLGAEELAVEEVLGDFDEGWAAMRAGEGIVAF